MRKANKKNLTPHPISLSGEGVYVAKIHYKLDEREFTENAPYLIKFPSRYAKKVFDNPDNVNAYAISFRSPTDANAELKFIYRESK